jgi:hypothetical protein
VNVLTTTPLWVVNTRLKMKGLGSRSGPGSTQHVADQYSGLLGMYHRLVLVIHVGGRRVHVKYVCSMKTYGE